MNLELIGERQYIQSVQDQNGVWVLMKENTAYAVRGDTGESMGTWNSLEDAEEFSNGLEMCGLERIHLNASGQLAVTAIGGDMRFESSAD